MQTSLPEFVIEHDDRGRSGLILPIVKETADHWTHVGRLEKLAGHRRALQRLRAAVHAHLKRRYRIAVDRWRRKLTGPVFRRPARGESDQYEDKRPKVFRVTHASDHMPSGRRVR